MEIVVWFWHVKLSWNLSNLSWSWQLLSLSTFQSQIWSSLTPHPQKERKREEDARCILIWTLLEFFSCNLADNQNKTSNCLWVFETIFCVNSVSVIIHWEISYTMENFRLKMGQTFKNNAYVVYVAHSWQFCI